MSRLDDLYDAVGKLKSVYQPHFVSITYGAGGGTRKLTLNIADNIQRNYLIPAMHHLTCIGHTESELEKMVARIREKNIRNILALRGDRPKSIKNFKKETGDDCYAFQLCKLIREKHGDFFSIGVAGFPEGHVDTPDKVTDSKYLKLKVLSGGQFVITQLFFDPDIYPEYAKRIRSVGVRVRIIPGILPVTSYLTLLEFCKRVSASVPETINDIFKFSKGDKEQFYNLGIEYTVKQCKSLLDYGSPGLHFYTLNKSEPVSTILEKLKKDGYLS